MKAGTTSLFHYLKAHPQVFMSPLKEVDFFLEEANWERGLDWYRKQFDGAGPDATAIGEASTAYTSYPEFAGVPERLAATLPDAHLIYVMRDPIERIRSHYQHRVLVGEEHAPLEVAVSRDRRYVDRSSYAMQLERYLGLFPRDQILLVTSEDLRHVRVPTMQRIQRFLEIDPDFVPGEIDREFYRTQERASYPPYVWWIRRAVKRFVPAGRRPKKLIDRMVSASFGRGDRPPTTPAETGSSSVPEGLRSQLADQLHDDVARLRSFMPDTFDGWGIA
jgi:Sulfotransferase domain